MGEYKDKAMWRSPMPQGKTERERQLELELERAKAENLRQEVAKMNKNQEYWRHYHIQAAIAAMQGLISNPQTAEQLDHNEGYKEIRGGDKTQLVAIASVMYADALVAELQKKEGNNETN